MIYENKIRFGFSRFGDNCITEKKITIIYIILLVWI